MSDLAVSGALVLIVTVDLVALFELRGGVGTRWLLSLQPWQALPVAALSTWTGHVVEKVRR